MFTGLVLLNLAEAFDTVDRDILLKNCITMVLQE